MKQKLKHPYSEFENSQLWKTIDKAISDLIKNQDIELTTRKEYVIGYICKALNKLSSNSINEASTTKNPL